MLAFEAPKAATPFKLQTHLHYTVPLTLILWLVARPFLDRSFYITTAFLTLLTLVFTTPWENLLLWTWTWFFSSEAIVDVAGVLPIEEYFYFVIQTILILLWAFLCLQWTIPILHLKERSHLFVNLMKWIPVTLLLTISCTGYLTIRVGLFEEGTSHFYVTRVLVQLCPIIALNCIGAGVYVVKRIKVVIISILVPTCYFYVVDTIALHSCVSIVNLLGRSGSSNFIESLSHERALVFLVQTTLLVTAYCAVEKSIAIMEMYPQEFNEGSMLSNLFTAFLRVESNLQIQTIEDMEVSLAILRKGSKSLWFAGAMFPSGIKRDICLLYGFCRVTDDIADAQHLSKKEKITKINILRKFLDQIFADRDRKSSNWKYGTWKSKKSSNFDPTASVDWSYFKTVLSSTELKAFRSLSRVVYYLPPEPFYELCLGYEWDVQGRVIQSEAELIQYAGYVAGTIGILCAYILHNENRGWFSSKACTSSLQQETHGDLIDSCRDMGVCIQLVNIARDIVTDSEQLGRCYIPPEYFNEQSASSSIEMLTLKRDPWSLGSSNLRTLALRVLDLSDIYHRKAQAGMDLSPIMSARPVTATMEIYRSIRKKIRANPQYIRKVSATTFTKLQILVSKLYLP